MQTEKVQNSLPCQPVKTILSLIACSRNDHYMGNSRWRLQTALNYVAQSVQEVGREGDVEVLVTDWGSEVPLHMVLHLTPAAERLVTFIIVPPALAKELQGDSTFSEVIALNAVARHAKGQYVGRIDQDTLVGTRFIRTFFDLYEGKQKLDVPLKSALMLSNRRQIPYRFASRSPSFWEVDRLIRWFGRFLGGEMYHLPSRLFIRSYVGIWLVHRNVWFECGGYDERMKYYNWMEVDMILRLKQRMYTLVDFGKVVDYDLYHLEHNPPLPDQSFYANRKVNPRIDFENPPHLDFHPNSEDWGLRQYSLEIVTYSSSQGERDGTMFASPRFRWPAFVLLLLSTIPLLVWDKLWIPVFMFLARWNHRITVVKEFVRGQPLTEWLATILELWRLKMSQKKQ